MTNVENFPQKSKLNKKTSRDIRYHGRVQPTGHTERTIQNKIYFFILFYTVVLLFCGQQIIFIIVITFIHCFKSFGRRPRRLRLLKQGIHVATSIKIIIWQWKAKRRYKIRWKNIFYFVLFFRMSACHYSKGGVAMNACRLLRNDTLIFLNI